MAFSATFDITLGIAKITLAGELDGSVTDIFRMEVQKAADHEAKRLVLIMDDLEFISSAGLRVLVFAKQKMGPSVDLFMVGAQEQVMSVIEQVGLHRSVIALNTYDATAIENF
jgi:anti-anti-sigma factor